jgi:hypothetical protein
MFAIDAAPARARRSFVHSLGNDKLLCATYILFVRVERGGG